MTEVELKKVSKRFGNVTAVRGVDLHIAGGEFAVFVGPSGCGKSTLLRLIAGLEDITSGDLFIGGERVNARAPKERGVAMVFQSYALYPHMTAYDNMAFGLTLDKAGKAEIDKAVREAAATLELTPFLDRLPRQLSGGQRQRVAIGRAIVRKPRVFLFDEPLSNLDAALRVQMRVEIARLHKEMGVTMIYVTHDQVEAMTLADRIVVLNAGQVEQTGRPLDLYHRPQNLFVAGFIGAPRMNFIETSVRAADPKGVRVALPGETEIAPRVRPGGLAAGDKVTLGIRPEHVTREGDGVTLAGRAEVIEELGEAHLLHVRLEDGPMITAKLAGDPTVGEGQAVTLVLAPGHCHLFRADGMALERTM